MTVIRQEQHLVILFIPDKFMDFRMWNDIPDRIQDHAEIVHLDRYAQIPWTTADDIGFLDTVRQLARARTFDIVVAAGQAARFGFAVAQAGLAGGLMLFYPSPGRPMDEVSFDGGDLDPADVLKPYLPVLDALRETDASRRRDILLAILSDTASDDVDMAELDRALGMMGDHAEEFFAQLRAQPDPPGAEWSWIDHLADLAVPITAVVAPGGAGQALGEAIGHRAADAEIVVASSAITPVAESTRSTEALLRMLDRVTR
jgi:hypothetical protein